MTARRLGVFGILGAGFAAPLENSSTLRNQAALMFPGRFPVILPGFLKRACRQNSAVEYWFPCNIGNRPGWPTWRPELHVLKTLRADTSVWVKAEWPHNRSAGWICCATGTVRWSFPQTLLGIWGILTGVRFSALALLCLDQLPGGDWLVSGVRSGEMVALHESVQSNTLARG